MASTSNTASHSKLPISTATGIQPEIDESTDKNNDTTLHHDESRSPLIKVDPPTEPIENSSNGRYGLMYVRKKNVLVLILPLPPWKLLCWGRAGWGSRGRYSRALRRVLRRVQRRVLRRALKRVLGKGAVNDSDKEDVVKRGYVIVRI